MAVKIPKKEAPRFLLVFLVIFVIFMIILGIMLGGGGEPEAPYSSDMESGDNAYVDIRLGNDRHRLRGPDNRQRYHADGVSGVLLRPGDKKL